MRVFWPALIWSALVLLFATQAWWASFGLNDEEDWRFATFAIILLQMGLLYMLAAVVLPDVPDGAAIDLQAHYAAQRRPFFGCLIAVVAVSLLKDLMLDGTLPSVPNLAFHGLLAVIALVGFTLRGGRGQLVLAAVSGIIFVAYIGLLFARL